MIQAVLTSSLIDNNKIPCLSTTMCRVLSGYLLVDLLHSCVLALTASTHASWHFSARVYQTFSTLIIQLGRKISGNLNNMTIK